MPLHLFYTMVQKSQKWPKTQIKSCLKESVERSMLLRAVFLIFTGNRPWRPEDHLCELFFFQISNQRKDTKKATEHVRFRGVLGHWRTAVINRTTFHACHWSRKTAVLALISRVLGLIRRVKAFNDQQCQFLTRNKSLSNKNHSSCWTPECAHTNSVFPQGADHNDWWGLIQMWWNVWSAEAFKVWCVGSLLVTKGVVYDVEPGTAEKRQRVQTLEKSTDWWYRMIEEEVVEEAPEWAWPVLNRGNNLRKQTDRTALLSIRMIVARTNSSRGKSSANVEIWGVYVDYHWSRGWLVLIGEVSPTGEVWNDAKNAPVIHAENARD